MRFCARLRASPTFYLYVSVESNEMLKFSIRNLSFRVFSRPGILISYPILQSVSATNTALTRN